MPGDALETARYAKAVQDLHAHYPQITVLPVQYSQADVNTAARVAGGLLTAHPDLSAIYAGDGDTGVGVASAVQVAGKSGKVKVISFDTEPNEVSALQRGTIQALYSQAPYVEGYEAMTGLVNYLRSRSSSTAAVVPSKPYYTPTPLKFITKATLNQQAAKQFIYRTSC
jgi:ribose transport system substrate-binding protein